MTETTVRCLVDSDDTLRVTQDRGRLRVMGRHSCAGHPELGWMLSFEDARKLAAALLAAAEPPAQGKPAEDASAAPTPQRGRRAKPPAPSSKRLSILAYANGFTLWHYRPLPGEVLGDWTDPGFKRVVNVGDQVLTDLGNFLVCGTPDGLRLRRL